ncbi:MAG: mannose-1-phosphate guanylyltransferase, partial [Calditrichaeota bacterium]|nr:mannose-1-phosphate guanylyltransferase [Calditrichota bacterium]
MTIYSVLMAGGVGTRFWPRSRETSPKQVLNIVGEQTMIQATHR